VACADDAGQQTETAVLAMLDGAVTWAIIEKNLTLTKGDSGLTYRATS
jgi:heat shock protein HslJ